MAATVLVVEDDEDLNDIWCLVLSREGYRVARAWDGEAAMELIRSEDPDLVLLDLLLPIADGWDVCRFLDAEPAGRRIPVIVTTCKGDRQDIEQARQFGVAGYFVKPFEMSTVLRIMEKTLAPKGSPGSEEALR